MESNPRATRLPVPLAAALPVAFTLLLALATAIGELLALAEQPGGSTAIDSSITTWFVAHRTPALTLIARDLSTVGSQAVLTPLTAIAMTALVVRRRRVAAGLLAAAWGGAIGLYMLAKQLVDRTRPPAHLWLTNVGRTPSFPSGHATQSLATLGALTLVATARLPGARVPAAAGAAILTLAIGCSRVYLGVHWATDVVAGWLLAASWLVIVLGLTRGVLAGAQRPEEGAARD